MEDNDTVTRVSEIPMCDLCKAFKGKNDIPAVYDGATKHGPWGYMCQEHFDMYGIGLGMGRGQRLKLSDDDS